MIVPIFLIKRVQRVKPGLKALHWTHVMLGESCLSFFYRVWNLRTGFAGEELGVQIAVNVGKEERYPTGDMSGLNVRASTHPLVVAFAGFFI